MVSSKEFVQAILSAIQINNKGVVYATENRNVRVEIATMDIDRATCHDRLAHTVVSIDSVQGLHRNRKTAHKDAEDALVLAVTVALAVGTDTREAGADEDRADLAETEGLREKLHREFVA